MWRNDFRKDTWFEIDCYFLTLFSAQQELEDAQIVIFNRNIKYEFDLDNLAINFMRHFAKNQYAFSNI